MGRRKSKHLEDSQEPVVEVYYNKMTRSDLIERAKQQIQNEIEAYFEELVRDASIKTYGEMVDLKVLEFNDLKDAIDLLRDEGIEAQWIEWLNQRKHHKSLIPYMIRKVQEYKLATKIVIRTKRRLRRGKED